MENGQFSDQELARRNKVEQLKELGIAPFGKKYNRTHLSQDIKNEFGGYTHEELEEKNFKVSVAGRIMFIRKMGKASFFSIQDKLGNQQIYISINDVGEEQYSLFKMADIGDIVGVEGVVMLTQTGALTVKALKYTHLTKALRPLPEKFHGLVDVEERYRRRYVDLIMNEEAKKVALLRPRIIRTIQNFMDNQGFIEVETPVLQPILGGAAARPFVTHHNTLDMDFYLRIATELPLKRLIVGGLERVYEIGRIFRNEGMDQKHNPEFTTMEAYMAYGDMYDMMDLCENLFREVLLKTINTLHITRNNVELDFEKPFERISMKDIVLRETGIDFDKIESFEEAKKLAEERHLKVEDHFNSVGHILNLFFEEYCEDKLVQPTFLYGHPTSISPLAKKGVDERYAERFEFFIMGTEYANAFSELNDPIDQKARFEAQLEERNRGNDEANQVDTDYVEALEYGLAPTGGIGVGIDRLCMLVLDKDTIREVLLFPHMKNK